MHFEKSVTMIETAEVTLVYFKEYNDTKNLKGLSN